MLSHCRLAQEELIKNGSSADFQNLVDWAQSALNIMETPVNVTDEAALAAHTTIVKVNIFPLPEARVHHTLSSLFNFRKQTSLSLTSDLLIIFLCFIIYIFIFSLSCFFIRSYLFIQFASIFCNLYFLCK